MTPTTKAYLLFRGSVGQKDRALNKLVASLDLLVYSAQQSAFLATCNSLALNIFRRKHIVRLQIEYRQY